MLYTCDKCHYTYEMNFLQFTCPDCGSHAIRHATDDEENWYSRIQQEKLSNPLLLDREVQPIRKRA